MNDIVYILKKGIDPYELTYSLRSVEANFPHGKIIFAGAKPEGIIPDIQIVHEQHGPDRYAKVCTTIRRICSDDRISDQFWLFNDDFFVMQPIDDLPQMIGGTLWHHIQRLEKKYGTSHYIKNLRKTAQELKSKGYDRLDYALHVPMLIDKEKAIATLDKFDSPMFRTIYGNHHKVGGVVSDDVKIYDIKGVPSEDCVLLSTTDETFRDGRVGEYIRGIFGTPSKYELDRIGG